MKPVHTVDCECAFCKNNKPFDIPDDLRSSLLTGKVALFAGAGVSTEGQDNAEQTFYDELSQEIGITDRNVDFPDLCSKFCNRPNGRLRFMELLLKRFKHIKSTPEWYRRSTRFHRAIAPMNIIDTIVTTNWDDYFERECWATPFISSEDTAFWSSAGRRLLKIHGTIESPGSIVATNEDYKECSRRLSKDIIGSRLKVILSEKTIVFMGYSLRDSDFREIMEFVKAEMGGFHRQAYIVTLDESSESGIRYADLGIIPIYTDATYFAELLYEDWRSHACVAPRSLYAEAGLLSSIIQAEHNQMVDKIGMFKHPEVLISMFYQDGLIHSLDRISHHYKSGEYTDVHATQTKIHAYNDLRSRALKKRRYGDAAYIEGYMNGLIFAAAYRDVEGEDLYPPRYFLFPNRNFGELRELRRALKDKDQIHKPSAIWAEKTLSRYNRDDNFVLQH